jgi:hypothetical protein
MVVKNGAGLGGSNSHFLPRSVFPLQPPTSSPITRGHVIHTEKGPSQGQRNANTDAVRTIAGCLDRDAYDRRGLDNAGKTTIVKRIMNEDVTTVSPTLGFIIKTIDFMG